MLTLVHCSLAGLSDGQPKGDAGSEFDGTANEGGAPSVPVEIASAQGTIGGIASNGSYVAWSVNSEDIRVCASSGCTTPWILIHKSVTDAVAFSGSALFYMAGPRGSSGPIRCTIEETNGLHCDEDDEGLTIGFDLGDPRSFAVDQGNIFVGSGDRRVLACASANASGCYALDGWTKVADGVTTEGAVALTPTRVYWSAPGASGSIYTCPRTGCSGTPTPSATNQGDPRAMTASGDSVYWTASQSGKIAACDGDCSAGERTVSDGQAAPLGIAFSSGKLYWANESAGTIVRCDPSACTTPELVARGLDRPQWIAVDSANVYVSTAGGSIYRAAK